MKKYSLTLLFLCFAVVMFGQKAKYIFYFIGDGMGVNQVNGTEAWRAELQGRIGIQPLCFAQFPYSASCHHLLCHKRRHRLCRRRHCTCIRPQN
jgi:alkaline phosphatase